jgi:hypothetical protein
MKEPKFLIVTPTYDGKDYCMKQYLDTVKKILHQTPNSKCIVVDNSKSTSYLTKLRRHHLQSGVSFYHVPRGKNSRDAITNSMNFGRQYMLRYDYDYMLVLEIDLVPSSDVILRFYSSGKDVVGAWYYIGFEGSKSNPRRPCVFKTVLDPKTRIGGTRPVSNDEAAQQWLGRGLKQCHGMGLGCTMIARRVVERFPFFTTLRMENKHHDVYFYMDLHNNHVPVFVDTDYVIAHNNSEWGDVKDR